MQAKQAVEVFGSVQAVADAALVKRQGVYQWLHSKRGMVPLVRALLLQKASGGLLGVNPMDYLDLNRHEGQGIRKKKAA